MGRIICLGFTWFFDDAMRVFERMSFAMIVISGCHIATSTI